MTPEVLKAGREVLFKHYGSSDLKAMADRCVEEIYEAMANEKQKQALASYWTKVAEDDEHYSNR